MLILIPETPATPGETNSRSVLVIDVMNTNKTCGRGRVCDGYYPGVSVEADCCDG